MTKQDILNNKTYQTFFKGTSAWHELENKTLDEAIDEITREENGECDD